MRVLVFKSWFRFHSTSTSPTQCMVKDIMVIAALNHHKILSYLVSARPSAMLFEGFGHNLEQEIM